MDQRNFNGVLFLGPSDLKDVVDIAKAIDLVEQGYREAADYPIVNAPRRRVHSPDNVRVSNFPGGVPGLGVKAVDRLIAARRFRRRRRFTGPE